MGNYINNHKKQRIKGYYICHDCGEFIKAIATKTNQCPFCGNEVELMMMVDAHQELITREIWMECGYYSDLRADLLIRKENT